MAINLTWGSLCMRRTFVANRVLWTNSLPQLAYDKSVYVARVTR